MLTCHDPGHWFETGILIPLLAISEVGIVRETFTHVEVSTCDHRIRQPYRWVLRPYHLA